MAHYQQTQFAPFVNNASTASISPPTARAAHPSGPSTVREWLKGLPSGTPDCCIAVAAHAAHGLESKADSASPKLLDEQPRPSIIKALKVLRTVQVVSIVVYMNLALCIVANLSKLRPLRPWAIFLSVNICLAAASLCFNVVWLTFTALPRTRARAFGSRPSCTNFTWDMASDITFAILWSCMVILDSISVRLYHVGIFRDSRIQAALFLSVALCCAHVATAVLNGCVRKQLLKATSAANAGSRLGGVVNEVALQKLGEGAVAGPGRSGHVSTGRVFDGAANCRAML